MNHKNVAQAILKCLNHFNVEYENVLAYGSDNVSYMKKSFEAILSNMLPNARHITCDAHIIALAGDFFREFLTSLDSFNASIKFIFSKAAQIRRRYIESLRSIGISRPI